MEINVWNNLWLQTNFQRGLVKTVNCKGNEISGSKNIEHISSLNKTFRVPGTIHN